jgi:hypothetical protein
MKIRWRLIVSGLLIFGGVSCVSRDYYTVNDTGPHGVSSTHKVYYTQQQLADRAAQDQQMQQSSTLFPSKSSQSPANDDDLAKVQAMWPKLSQAQRDSVVDSVTKMSQEK